MEIELLPKQLEAIPDWTSDHFELCYDGTARSGKTFFICYAIINRAINHPGSRHLIARYRGNHLEQTIWRQTFLPLIKELLPDTCYKIDKVYRTVTIQTPFMEKPSEIMGWGLDDEARIAKIMGSEFGSIFLNEFTQISYEVYQALKTRCVQNVPSMKNKIIGDCNPLNQYHWIYQYFIQHLNPSNPDEKIKNANKLTRRGPWLYTENKFLSKDGHEAIDSLSGVAHDRLAKGLWTSSEGLVWPEFENCLVEPFDMTTHKRLQWERYSSIDFGYSNPFGVLWCAQDYANETYYIVDEYYVRQKTVKEHSLELKKSLTSCEWIVSDHDAEDRATLAENGIFTEPAQKDIVSGVECVRDLMTATHGWKIKIFNDLSYLISELNGYKYPEKKHGDLRDEKPVKQNDHLMDCLRYMCKRLMLNQAVKTYGRTMTRR